MALGENVELGSQEISRLGLAPQPPTREGLDSKVPA